MTKREFFLIHIHVFMLCRKFELISIKIGFFVNFEQLLSNFKSCSKIWPKTMAIYNTGNFIKNGWERILHFYKFLKYIYMFLCCVESLS